jgi:hypothetical protein
MVLNDCNSWIVSASLVMTLGFGGMFISPADMVGTSERSAFDKVVLHIYLSSMTLSSMVALSCVVDHISIYNLYNMVPSSMQLEARRHTYRLSSTQHSRGWADQLLHRCGLKYGSGAFFQSIQALLVGIICAIYLTHGAVCCVLPAVICCMFFYQMKDYNRIVHWGPDALPAFADSVLSRAQNHDF